MSEEKKKCVKCGLEQGKSLHSISIYKGDEKYYCEFCLLDLLKKTGEKNCAKCYLSNYIEKNLKELVERKEKYQQEKDNFPGYENSEEGKIEKRSIELRERNINTWKKQLSEIPCQKNNLCENPHGESHLFCFYSCSKCGKFLSFSIGFWKETRNDYKSPDFYTHEQNCQKQQSNLNNSNNKNNKPRERERERESILAYFKLNSIKSITLQDNTLIITYQDGKTETNQAQNQELSQIKSYLQTQATKTITQQELKEQQSTPPKKNYLPYILVGIGLVSLVGIIAYFLTKKNKENK